MEALECYRCGGVLIRGRCADCYPALPPPSDLMLANREICLAPRPIRVNARPIEPLRHAGELATFSSPRSLRKAGDIITTLGLIESQTLAAKTYFENPREGKGLHVRQHVWVQGLIFTRRAGGEMVIRELF